MPFVVDTVSEYTYFQNILLGLADALHNRIGVKRTFLKNIAPATYAEIISWEEVENVLLPSDLKLFYFSSNGFLFEWIYTFGDNSPENQVVGRIKVNPLEELTRVYGYETTNDPGITMVENGRYTIKLSPESKIFELSLLPERGKVVLIYLYPNYMPSIWILTTTMDFYYLASDIATYLKMAIVHLGIPNWQLTYTPQGLPQWTQNIFRMLLPNFLLLSEVLEKMQKERRKKDEDFKNVPLNKFNTELFKILPRPELPKPIQMLPEVDSHKDTKKMHFEAPPAPLPPPPSMKIKKYRRKPLYYVKKR